MFAQKAALVKLLSDNDPDTVRLVKEQLASAGEEALADLLDLDGLDNERVSAHVSDIIHRIHHRSAIEEFSLLCHFFGDGVDLEQASLALARAMDPQMRTQPCKHRLNHWGSEALEKISGAVSSRDRVVRLSAFLGGELGFGGNADRLGGRVNGWVRFRVPGGKLEQMTGTGAVTIDQATLVQLSLLTNLLAGDPAAAGRQAIEDARRQLIEKAAALYVEPRSLVQNYPVVRDRLLARSDAFIRTVLDEPPATLAKNGLVTASLRATVDVREVQKWLNQMSREERVQLIRNNGDPRIAVSIRVQRAGGEGAEPSEVAENVVKARIRSFGFSVFDPAVAKDSIDFNVEGTAALKKLSARLPSSGLTVEKFALTSFTTRAVDARSGQEVYTSTEIPKGRSWASEELALEEIGKLVGEQFSRTFFLENFEFASRRARLQFQGLPEGIAPALLSELQAVVPVLNAVIVDGGGMDVVLDLELSGGTTDPAELVQGSILRPLNRKLGRSCFSVAPAAAGALKVAFAAECRAPQIVSRLESRPPAALLDAASQRLDAIGSSGGLLQRVTTT